jgi:hypothetical protein
MRMQVVAAAMMLACITTAKGHSRYPGECCHDRDCHTGSKKRTCPTVGRDATSAACEGSTPRYFLIRRLRLCPKQRAKISSSVARRKGDNKEPCTAAATSNEVKERGPRLPLCVFVPSPSQLAATSTSFRSGV